MTFVIESQKLDQDTSIALLDIVHATAGTLRFSSGSLDPSDLIQYNGNTYQPRQMKVSGGLTAQGSKMPRPGISIDNVDGHFWSIVFLNNDLKGAVVTYREVYRANLDDGTSPSGTEHISEYSFLIHQMKSIDSKTADFQLITSIDREDAKFGRACLRHVCQREYRVADSGTAGVFFAQSDCPYGDAAKRPGTGGTYYKKDGTVTATWTEDDCGQRHSDCVLRFGATVNLPYQGMPSIGQRET